MGNSGAKFADIEIGSPAALPKEKCVDGKSPGKATQKYSIALSGDMPTDFKKTPTVEVKNEAGELLFTSVAGTFMKTGGKEAVLSDAKGSMLAVTKFKMGFGGGTTRLLRTTATFKGQESKDTPWNDKETPVYNYATIVSKQGYTDTATYSLVTSDGEELLYKASKKGFKFQAVVVDKDDVVVAKVSKTDNWGKKFEAEVAGGVDLVVVVLLSQSLASGGNPTGALAGAGVI